MTAFLCMISWMTFKVKWHSVKWHSDNFKEQLITASNQPNYNTIGHKNQTFKKSTINASTYGLFFAKRKVAWGWNKITDQGKNSGLNKMGLKFSRGKI